MFRIYADDKSIFDPANRELTVHSAKVTQEIGKAGTFQFVLPPTNEAYNKIQQLLTTIVVEYEITGTTYEIFRGRVFNVTTDFSKMKTVVCEGSLAYLVDSVQKASSFNGTAKHLLKKILNAHNEMIIGKSMSTSEWSSLDEKVRAKLFRLGDFDIENAKVIIPGSKDDDDAYNGSEYAQAVVEAIEDEWLTTYDFINDVIIDYLGGYLIARYDKNTGTNYLDVKSDTSLSEDPAKTTGSAPRQIEYGSNLLDLSEEFNPEELCTVVVPLGDSVDDKTLTIESSSKAKTLSSTSPYEIVSYNGKKVGIAHKKSVERYGRIIKTHSFSDVNDADTLYSDGVKWLNRNRNIHGRYTVKAIDMRFFDPKSAVNPIELGEMITIRSGQHDLDSTLLCTKIEYDLDNPANNAYTLGNPEQSLTERYRKDKKKEDRDSKHRSRKSGASAGKSAAAAQETATDALTKADEIEKQLKGAEILVDPDNASITLKTWYTMTDSALRRAGIDIDGKKGKIDIYTAYENAQKAVTGLTQISQWTDEKESVINLLSQHDTATSSAVASLNLRTTDLESIIEQLASYQTETSLTTASITARADAQGASIDSLTEFKDRTTDQLVSVADLKLQVDKDSAEVKALAQHFSETTEGLASLKVRVDDDMALVEQMADFISESAQTTATISAKADANGSYIEALNEFKDKATGELKGLASTKQWVDENSAGIKQVTEWYGKYGTKALTTLAQYSDETLARIEAAAEFYGKHSEALTSIQELTTEKMAQIQSAATFVNRNSDDGSDRAITVGMAGTTATANESRALWDAYASFYNKKTKSFSIGSITITADTLGSRIGLTADQIKLTAKNIEVLAGKVSLLKKIELNDKVISVKNRAHFTKDVNLNNSNLYLSEGYGVYIANGDSNTKLVSKKELNDILKDYAKKSDVPSVSGYVTKSSFNTHVHKFQEYTGSTLTNRITNYPKDQLK